ncbi:MAG TPA: PDZ domain-containing protein [Opitutaceae bacterium]|nr:PDZ domain-containing protein [Opitutaceae bacterium]
MKTCLLRPLASTLALAAVLSAFAAAADNAPPPPEKKEMRIIAPRDGARIEHNMVFARDGAGEKETVTFLGIETAPVSPTLTVQLGLPRDSGLVVNRIQPNSPAAAVLQEHDILLKLDDQILVDQRQLSVLIRNHKADDEVTLTYVRAGKETTAKVKLAQHDVPKMALQFESAMPNDVFAAGASHADGAGGRVAVDHLLSLMSPDRAAPGGGPGLLSSGSRVIIDRNRGGGFHAVGVNPDNSNIVYTDDAGALDLTIKDGQQTLVAKNVKGEQIFSGPVTTPEERKALPPGVRERLEKLEGMRDVTFRTDADFQGAETRVVRPFGQGISVRHLPVSPAHAPAFF